MTRTCDRLRSMSVVRLAAERPEGHSRAQAAFDLAQEFADRAAELAHRPPRALPDLGVFAAGDVLAVCAHDLVEELAGHDPKPAGEVCADAVARLIDLRRSL